MLTGLQTYYFYKTNQFKECIAKAEIFAEKMTSFQLAMLFTILSAYEYVPSALLSIWEKSEYNTDLLCFVPKIEKLVRTIIDNTKLLTATMEPAIPAHYRTKARLSVIYGEFNEARKQVQLALSSATEQNLIFEKQESLKLQEEILAKVKNSSKILLDV